MLDAALNARGEGLFWVGHKMCRRGIAGAILGTEMLDSLAKRYCVTVNFNLPLRTMHNNPQPVLNAGRPVAIV